MRARHGVPRRHFLEEAGGVAQSLPVFLPCRFCAHVLSATMAMFTVFTATVVATMFYSLVLVLPSCLDPVGKRAVLWQYLSLVVTVMLPVVWSVYTVYFVEPLGVGGESHYWGSEEWHGSAGNHDFCEPNYVYYRHVIEFHNTWSSLPVIFYGTVGTYYTRKFATLEKRFPCTFISIGAVGVGSTLFHGALRSWGQILDEVPMLCIIFAFAYCHLETKAKPDYYPWLPVALMLSCALFVAGYLFFYFYAFFLVGFSGGVVTLLLCGATIYGKSSELSKRIFLSGVLSLLIGFLCWIVDDQFCNQVHHLNLHIGWHVFTGLGGYLFGLFQVTLRAAPLKKRAVLIAPWIVRNTSQGGFDLVGMEMEVVNARSKGAVTMRRVDHLPEFLLPYVALRS